MELRPCISSGSHSKVWAQSNAPRAAPQSQDWQSFVTTHSGASKPLTQWLPEGITSSFLPFTAELFHMASCHMPDRHTADSQKAFHFSHLFFPVLIFTPSPTPLPFPTPSYLSALLLPGPWENCSYTFASSSYMPMVPLSPEGKKLSLNSLTLPVMAF